jgi:hypothetical protein
VIAGASELAKRSALLGAILISLPLSSILALSWLWLDTKDAAKTADFASSVLWAVLPSLLFFALLPALLRRGWGYWASLGASCAAMAAAYAVYASVLPRLKS